MGGGLLALALTVANQVTATSLDPALDPALERASVLASLLAVALLLIGSLWTRIVPRQPEPVALRGEQGFELVADLPAALGQELAWGSAMLLTASPAAVVCLLWQDRVLLRRGLLGGEGFQAGPICRRSLEQGRAISLVDLRLYPGRDEFERLLPDLPAVVVQPLAAEGVLLVGGCTARCFDRSDLAWIEGWGRKITAGLAAWPVSGDDPREASPESAPSC